MNNTENFIREQNLKHHFSMCEAKAFKKGYITEWEYNFLQSLANMVKYTQKQKDVYVKIKPKMSKFYRENENDYDLQKITKILQKQFETCKQKIIDNAKYNG